MSKYANNRFFLSQKNCAASTCGASFRGIGHDMCRSHAACRTRCDKAMVWNPELCGVCTPLTNQYSDPTTARTLKREIGKMIRTWVRGFQKNNLPTDPYLAAEKWRRMFFPRASKKSVAVTMPEEVLTGLKSLDVNTVDMEEIPKEVEDQLLNPKTSDPSFSGFDEESIASSLS